MTTPLHERLYCRRCYTRLRQSKQSWEYKRCRRCGHGNALLMVEMCNARWGGIAPVQFVLSQMSVEDGNDD